LDVRRPSDTILGMEIQKIYFASDHAGYELKSTLIEYLRASGVEVEDMGAHTLDTEDDYPDFITPCAQKVAMKYTSARFARTGVFGIIIGGSGQGEAMSANRINGIRATVFYGGANALGAIEEDGTNAQDTMDIVRLARRHNDANILSLGARFISVEKAKEAVDIFLNTEFSNLPRHIRRIAKF